LTVVGASSLAAIAGCLGDDDDTDDTQDDDTQEDDSPEEDEPEIESLEIEIEDTTIDIEGTESFTVTAQFDDDRFEDVTDNAEITVGNEAVVTVADEEITAEDHGETTLTAEYEGVEEEVTIDVPIQGLDERAQVFDGLFDPGFINEVFEDGGITFGDGTEYPGRFVAAESDGETVSLEAVTPYEFEEEGGQEDRFALATSIDMGFFTDDPEQLEDEFTYEEFDISVEKIDGEDLGEAVVRTEWFIEALEEDDFELFFERINEENR